MADYDLAIIGGGINGTAIARDAAGRGLRVLLVEQNDLASGTSSASTKLIHGGLRYLEQGAFRLVREALAEREVLLRMAPHIIRPMRFALPPARGLLSAFRVRFGLWLYDMLGERELLPPASTIDLTHHRFGQPLKRSLRYGFEYSDCWVDDARLVVLLARDAAERGAVIRTRTRCVRAERGERWELVLSDRGKRDVATARVLVNAAGPWIAQVSETVLRRALPAPVRLVKGSHVVVKRVFDHDGGYIFQASDKRVVFALPFAGDFTLIGTTDREFVGDLSALSPSSDEILYLLDEVNAYFRKPIGPDEVVHAFSGVRALYDDGSGRPEDVTRDYELKLEEQHGRGPLLTVYGGKITTCRRLAEEVMSRIGIFFESRPAWTKGMPLPGGSFPADDFEGLLKEARERWPFLPEPLARRLLRAYGTRMETVMDLTGTMDHLGERFVGDLTAAELRYLHKYEWAVSAEDVLWRRSKLGLVATPEETQAIAAFMAALDREAHPA